LAGAACHTNRTRDFVTLYACAGSPQHDAKRRTHAHTSNSRDERSSLFGCSTCARRVGAGDRRGGPRRRVTGATRPVSQNPTPLRTPPSSSSPAAPNTPGRRPSSSSQSTQAPPLRALPYPPKARAGWHDQPARDSSLPHGPKVISCNEPLASLGGILNVDFRLPGEKYPGLALHRLSRPWFNRIRDPLCAPSSPAEGTR
jgi:hypothetical protein